MPWWGHFGKAGPLERKSPRRSHGPVGHTNRTADLRRQLAALAAIVLGAGGCGEQSIPQGEAAQSVSRAYCKALFRCDCASQYGSETDCADDVERRIQVGLAEGDASGLSYDGACVADHEAAIGDLGCDTLYDALRGGDDPDPQLSACKVFNGSAGAGESCSTLAEIAGDNCRRGLVCAQGGCSDPKSVGLVEGSACDPFTDVCNGDLECLDVKGDGMPVCAALPRAGEPCSDTLPVCQDAACDVLEGVCVKLPGADQSCLPPSFEPRCNTRSLCNNDTGRCRGLPVEDEPCGVGGSPCAPGLACADGICATGDALVCNVDPIG